MSHVNRNDRLSRRILGFLGRLDAVESMVKGSPKVCEVEAQNLALAERVAKSEGECAALRAMLESLSANVAQFDQQAQGRIDALAGRVMALEVETTPEPSKPQPAADVTVGEVVAHA